MTDTVTPAAPSAARVSAPSFLNGTARVFDLSLGEMLWSRRTIFMAIVLGAPVLLALVVRIVDASGIAPLRVNGVARRRRDDVRRDVLVVVSCGSSCRCSACSTARRSSRTKSKTRRSPICSRGRSARSAVLLGKYAAYLVCTSLVVLPSVMVVYFLIVPFREVGQTFLTLLTDLGLLALGLAVYGALFALAGTVMKRPLLVGLIFAFGWEQIAMVMPGYLRRFTAVYYLQGLVPHAIPSDGIVSLLAAVFSEAPSAAVCLFWLFVALVSSLALAMRAVERREYVLSQ